MTILPVQQYTKNQLRASKKSGLCIKTLTRSSLVVLKNLTDYSRRPRSGQDRVQDISEDCQSNLESLLLKEKSKVFRNSSQSTAEFWKLWRGFVDCLKITKDKSLDSRVHTSDTIHPTLRRRARSSRLSRARSLRPSITAVSKREAQNPRPRIATMSRREAKLASQYHRSVKTRGSKPASQHHRTVKTRGSKPASQYHRSIKTQGSSSRLAKLEICVQ